MAQADVQLILEGLKQHTEKLFKQRELQIEQQRADVQAKAEEDRTKQAVEQLKQQKAQFDAQHDLAKKAADLVHVQALQKVGQTVQEGGPVPQGMTSSPTASSLPSGEANYTPANPAAATGQRLDLPGVGSIQVATPQAYATQQADLARITNKPAEEAKTRESVALEEARGKERLAGKAMDLDRANAIKQYDDQIKKEQFASQMALEKFRQLHEDYRAGLKNQVDQTDLSPYMAQAVNGELTQQDIKKLPLKPVDQMKILNGVISGGGKVLKDEDKQSLMDIATISSAIPHLGVALDLLKTNPVAVRTPGTDAFKQYQEAVHQAELVLPQVGRVIAGDKGRMSNQQIKYAEGSFLPSRNPLTADYSTNEKNVKDFVATMEGVVDNHTRGMTPGAKALLKQNFKIQPLKLIGLPPGSASEELSPKAQELLKRHGIN